MILLLSFCSFPWWLAWLLPFLLGLLAGWAIWSKYRSESEERALRISSLEDEVSACRKGRTECEEALVNCRANTRNLEAELTEVKAELKNQASMDLGGVAAGFVAGIAAGGDDDIYAALPSDNLQFIEGVGPKMEAVMKENGINNWTTLAAKSPADLQVMLAKYGDKYRIIDPTTWPQQAMLARDGKWEELITLQKDLDTGKTNTLGGTDSKLEKLMIKMGLLKKFAQDDLKAVEGIGPKIADLLHQAGITTWQDLSVASVHHIQEILDAAGSRYKLADPGTWPQQAGLAAQGRWKELQKLQDELTGGR